MFFGYLLNFQVTKLHQDTLKVKDVNLIEISKLEALNDELRRNNTAQSKKILDQQTVRASVLTIKKKQTFCWRLERKY